MLLAQSSNTREHTRTHGNPLLALAVVPVIFFGLGVVLAGNADDHPAIDLPAVHTQVEPSLDANRMVPLSLLTWNRTDG